jgi:hypothetical protein
MIGKSEQLEPNDMDCLSSESQKSELKPSPDGLCVRQDQWVRTPVTSNSHHLSKSMVAPAGNQNCRQP